MKGSAFQNETYEKGAPLSVKNCIETSKGLNLGAELTQYKTLSSNPLSRPKWSLCSLVKSKHPLSSCLLSFYSRITFLGCTETDVFFLFNSIHLHNNRQLRGKKPFIWANLAPYSGPCSSRARWPLVPNYCSRVTRKS